MKTLRRYLDYVQTKWRVIYMSESWFKVSPVTKNIYELVEGIQAVLGREKKGKPVQTFVSDGILYNFANCGIVYNETKL